MLNNFLSLNVPIQGIPLFTYLLFGATTFVLAIVTLNESPSYNNTNPVQSQNNNLTNETTDLYKSTGGGGKQYHRVSKKRNPLKKIQQTKKRYQNE